MAKVNWTIIRNEYITNEQMSYDQLAEKHGISKQSITTKAVKEDWQKLRKEALLKVSQKLAEKTTTSIADFQAKKYAIGEELVNIGMDGIRENKPKTARTAREVVDSGVKIQTEAMGLDKANAQVILNQTNNFIPFSEAMVKFKQALKTNGKVVEGEIVS